MGIKKSHIGWTTGEERILREKWYTRETVKSWLNLLQDGRSYQSVIAHAAVLELGPRPIVRSTYSAAWDESKRLLQTGLTLTTKEIAVRTGFSARHLQDLLESKLKVEPREIHITNWQSRGSRGGYVEVWAFGDLQNVAMPKSPNRDEVNQRRRARRAAEQARIELGPFAVAGLQLMRDAA